MELTPTHHVETRSDRSFRRKNSPRILYRELENLDERLAYSQELEY